jgi:N-acetylmuramoyl-L-alanine amidase
MPPPFQDLDPKADPPEFVRLLSRFPFERKVTAVHLHHTWRPRRGQWGGRETLRTLWYTHTLQFGWSDIAQHLTIAPDGQVWTGRSWNRPPCSCPYENGTRAAGPFMITLIGDFNRDGDRFDGSQYEQTVDVIARVHSRFGLDDDSLRFHRDLDPSPTTTCPGNIDRDVLVKAVSARRATLPNGSAPARQKGGTPPFSEDAEAWYQFITVSNQIGFLLEDEPASYPQDLGDLVLGVEGIGSRKRT